MPKLRKIQLSEDSNEVDLSSRHFDNEEEEVALLDAKEPPKLKWTKEHSKAV